MVTLLGAGFEPGSAVDIVLDPDDDATGSSDRPTGGFAAASLDAGPVVGVSAARAVMFAAAQVDLASTTADADGDIDVDVIIPASLTPGDHEIAAIGTAPDGSTHTVTSVIRVQASGSSSQDESSSGPLPATGGDTGALAVVLAAMAGALAVGAVVRRVGASRP